MPSAGRMRPKTSESGILSTKRNSPVNTSMLTRMLVPKPKNAFQSPDVQIAGRCSPGVVIAVLDRSCRIYPIAVPLFHAEPVKNLYLRAKGTFRLFGAQRTTTTIRLCLGHQKPPPEPPNPTVMPLRAV